MSKIDDLIQKFCPNGVEYKSIKSLAEVGTGSSNGNEAQEGGEYPFFIRSQTVKRKNEWEYDEEAIIIPGEGGIGEIYHYVNGKYAIHQRVYRIHFMDDSVDVKFAYHYFRAFFKNFIMRKAVSATVKSIRKPMIEEFKLPVPPLEVQHEIVYILDSFTLLTAELTAELTARKKQYNFYRDALIQKEHKSEKVKLNTICEIYDGTHQTPQYTNSGIPFVSVENIDDLYGTQKFISPGVYEKYKIKPRIGDVFMTRITAGIIGKCTVVDRDDDLAYYVSLALLRPNANILDSKYLKYYLESGWGRRELSKWILWDATPTKINKNDIGRVLISVPPLDTQKRLVQVIEHFDAICTDLNIGLPAEIEARQKQYEYYRDLLLTFAEKGSTVLTDRQTELSAIKLIQYVFGYARLPLGKVANIFRGEYITKKNTKEGRIPVILGGQEPAYYIDKHNHDGEIVVVARSGASAGFVSYWNQKIFVTDAFGYEEKSELITTRYLYYILKNMESELNMMKRGAGVPHISSEMLNNIEVPVPTLQEQERITNILDRFDTLCNDLSVGLPAEIEARQKQYEYYRDVLLAFKERK